MDVGVDGSGSISIYMGAIAAGRLIYRLLQRRLSSSVVLLTSLLGHGLFLLLFLNIGALAAWLAVDVAVWVLIGALGLTIANLFPLFTVKIVEECRTERRIVASNILVVTGVIAAFLPLMFGAISDRASIHTAFSMVLAVCVVSALVVGLLLKSRPEMRPCAKLTEKTRRGARRTRYDRAQTPLKR